MTTPLWVFLAFAMWTLAVLLAGIGVRRWTLIFTGRAQLTDFPAGTPHGTPGYWRAMRAHANCVENLPVFGAIAVTAFATQTQTVIIDWLAVTFLAARIAQTLTHTLFTETNTTVLIRFLFFMAQIVCMIWMAAEIALTVPS